MESLSDYLAWFNGKSVAPLLEAIEKVHHYYKSKDICVFKSTVSVSGCARILLFRAGQKAGASFALFDRQNADTFKMIK